jgi:hypothetical protein
VPKRTYEHNDAFGIIQEWIGLLIDEIDERGIQGPDIKSFWNDRRTATPEDPVPLRTVARKIASQLNDAAGGPFGYGLCLDDIRVPSVSDMVFTVFGRARSICVLTVGEYDGDKKKVIAAYEQYKEAVCKEEIRVLPISGEDVRTLVTERWDFATNKEVKSPFPLDIDQAFADRTRPVKRVMVLVNKLLKLKATDFNAKRWPSDLELAFDRTEVSMKLKILDEPFENLG